MFTSRKLSRRDQYDTIKLCEYCVALANEGGGHLILGIADQMPRPVIGTAAFKDTNDIASTLLEWLSFRVDVEVIDHPDGRVLIFVVPSRQQGSAYHYHGKYLMRAGGSLVPMSEDRLRAIFAETKTDPLEEFEVSGISGEEAVELLDIASFFELMRLPFPSSQEAVIERLRNERLIDVYDGKVSIRRVAALLLGKRLEAFPAIRRRLLEWSSIPNRLSSKPASTRMARAAMP
jgi:ATP-dependent DNA helicase RecG